MHSSHQDCLNCERPLPAEAAYCPHCGQKTSLHRLSWHDIWHDAVHYFTHADKGIFSLLRDLAVRPGVVAREFVTGKRAKYFKPLNFYLLVAGILVLVLSKTLAANDAGAKPFQQKADRTKSLTEKASFETYAKRTRIVNNTVGRYANVVNMLATPIITIIFFLFYRRKQYRYIEHLVAHLYFVPFTMLFYALLISPLVYFLNKQGITIVLIGIFFVFEILYKGIAYYQFMGVPGRKALWKAIGVSAFAAICWIALTSTLIGLFIRTGFGIVH